MTRTTRVVGIRGGGQKVVPMTADEIAEEKIYNDTMSAEKPARAAQEVQNNRRGAYQSEADALFFEEQRGEVSAGTWAAKVDEIKARYPKD